MNVEVDEDTAVKYIGRHRDIGFEVSGFRFREKFDNLYEQPVYWATYAFLTEEAHEKYKHRIDRAPWNGGQTYYRKITEEHVDVTPELREKWDKPYYKIGDDFSHLWDLENRRWEMYNREYLTRHIKKVIDFLIDGGNEE